MPKSRGRPLAKCGLAPGMKVNTFTFMVDVAEQPRARRSRLRILETALGLFAAQGFEGVTIPAIAKEAGVSAGLVCRYFPTKEHLVLSLYERLALDLAARASDLPAGSIALRFGWLVEQKLALLSDHRAVLGPLVARAVDPASRAHVLGPRAAVVRSRVSALFHAVVVGADDAPRGDDAVHEARVLSRALYGAHLALVFLFVQDEASAHDVLGLVSTLIGLRGLVPPGVGLGLLEAQLGGTFTRLFASTQAVDDAARANLLLDRLFARRRTLPGVPAEASPAARALHLPLLAAAVAEGARLRLVLPAFPAKSPNPDKVLGKLPDGAEAHGLDTLRSLLDELEEAHPPGVELVICSDGAVFADAVGVRDADVLAYRDELTAMLARRGEARIGLFDLEDAFGELSPRDARARLLEAYGEDLEALRARAKASPSLLVQVDGIHRFLAEDERSRTPGLSASAAKKRTRALAYEVVRRSEAWGRLVAAAFPTALRLSIHPQPDVSSKIGVALGASDDPWLTPWHAALLVGSVGASLVHRRVAEEAGARIVSSRGRPFHLEQRA